jgi:hypothetical protein
MAKLLMMAGYVSWLNMPAIQAMKFMMAGYAVWLSMQNIMAG